MFLTLFNKEVLENIASWRFLLVFGLCLIIIPLGVYVSTRDFQTRQQSWQEAVNLFNESHKVPADLLYRGAKAHRQPSGLSFLSLGLEIIMPNLAETPNKAAGYPSSVELQFDNDQGADNIYEFFHGPLDLVFIVAVMMTFVAIAFSYGCISAEREQGTLKQILCNAVPRNQVILAKLAANYLSVIIPFLFSVLLSLLIFQRNTLGLFNSGGDWFRMSLALVFSLLLIGAFFNLGLLVSTLTRQAVSTIVFLLLCWVLLYGIVPRLGVFLAQAAYPVKSPTLLASEKEKLRSENEEECEAAIDKLFDAGGGSLDEQNALRTKYEEELRVRVNELDQEWKKRRDMQIAAATNLGRLSPVSCYIRPMAEISRTGWLTWQEFALDVSRFQQVLNEKIYGRFTIEVGKGGTEVREKELSGPPPAFRSLPVSQESLMNDILPDLVLLVVYNLLFFAGAFVKFLRYDVR